MKISKASVKSEIGRLDCGLTFLVRLLLKYIDVFMV